MKSFSERKGLKPIKNVIQIDSMDKELRNGLWNALTIFYWNRIQANVYGDWYLANDRNVEILFKRLWHNYFKRRLDTLSIHWPEPLDNVRGSFFSCEWNEVYDFVEFVANNYPDESTNKKFMDSCNVVLGREVSGYRFVGGKITPTTSEEEIGEIEDALGNAPKPVNIHLKTALDLLADRKSPNYRNSIKESISAVEAVCKLITSDSKATLDQALKKIEQPVGMHPALKKAFTNLYGYTSDAQGIRHALMGESELYFEDAKFMLVSCSAFINYLKTKASKAGIKL
jgi:hypothetical protein